MMKSGWQLRRLNGPQTEPVTLDEAKNHCRVDLDFPDDDELITALVRAAREQAEAYTHRSFAEQTFQLSIDEFPIDTWGGGAVIYLPFSPALELLSVTYLDQTGVRHDMDLETLQANLDAEPAYLLPAYGTIWPFARRQLGSVLIEYRAGFAGVGSPADTSGIPESVRLAIKMAVSHWYENRSAVEMEARVVPQIVPLGFERLLDYLRINP